MTEQRKAGFAVLCDIVGFSRKADYAQRACVLHLDQAVNSTRLMKVHLASHRDEVVVNCTGDGFILITTAPPVTNYPEYLLEFARDLLRSIHRWNAEHVGGDANLPYEVRLGVHEGRFYMGVHVFGSRNAIGSGVNVAARVASVGDAGHVLFSEDVVTALRETGPAPQRNGNTGRKDLLDRTETWQVAVKHGLELRLSPWSVDDGEGRLGALDPPKRVRELTAVQGAMLSTVADAKGNLEEHFRRACRVRPETLGLRLTLLFARDGLLRCTPIRAGASLPSSNVEYPLTKPDHWGMPAFVFHEPGDRVLWQDGLPQWKESSERSQADYIKRLHDEWRIPEGQVRRLGRKSRAYFGCKVLDFDGSPAGVLMADTLHPLDKLTEVQRQQAGMYLWYSALELAPLAHARYSGR